MCHTVVYTTYTCAGCRSAISKSDKQVICGKAKNNKYGSCGSTGKQKGTIPHDCKGKK